MTLLSDIYDVTLKRGNREAAKGGFVRPTIGEHFMTHKDFRHTFIPTISNHINPAYNNLTGDLYVYFTGYNNQGVTAHAGPTYTVPAGFNYERIYWPTGHALVGTGIAITNNYTITGTGWCSWRYDNVIVGKKYYEVTINGSSAYGDIGVVSSFFGYTGSGSPHVTEFAWIYDRVGRYITNNIQVYTPDSYSNGSIIGMAVDADNGRVWWSKNGIWQVDTYGNLPNL